MFTARGTRARTLRVLKASQICGEEPQPSGWSDLLINHV